MHFVIKEFFCASIVPAISWGFKSKSLDLVYPGSSKKMMRLIAMTVAIQALIYACFKNRNKKSEVKPVGIAIFSVGISVVGMPLIIKVSRAYQSALPFYVTYGMSSILNMIWVL